MKCVVIDDEPLAIRVLTQHLSKTEGFDLLRSFQNAFEALYYIQTKAVDLVFLDIQMPGVNGLQFIKILKYPPKIIITSAYREYALEALQLGVVDYLLKPIAYDRFLSAISKALDHRTPIQNTGRHERMDQDRCFYIKAGPDYVKVAEKHILFLKGERNYCRLQLIDRSLTLPGNLAHYGSRLRAENFFRAHKSYIVALDHIDRYNADFIWVNGFQIPIGRTYKRSLMSYLEQKRL